jgi:YVTN family beta-propeller protein
MDGKVDFSSCFYVLLPISFSISLLFTISIPPIVRAQTTQMPAEGVFIYKNFSQYSHPMGVNLTYPADWVIPIKKDLAFTLTAPFENNSVFFTMLALARGNQHIEEYVGANINDHKQNKTAFQLIESNRINVSDNPAYKIVFTYNFKERLYKVMEVYTMVGNKVYIINYEAPIDKYSSYLSTIEKMITSMKIQGIESINARTQSGIKLDGAPVDLAVNSITNKLYVAVPEVDKVYVIDGSMNKIISNITVGGYPNAVAINSDTNTIYIASPETDKVYVIDGFANDVVANISVGQLVGDIAVDTNEFGGVGSLAFVTNSGNNTVSVIDGTTNKNISNPIELGKSPFGVAINSISNRAYVTNTHDNSVSVIDYVTFVNRTFTGKVIDNIKVGIFPTAIAVDSNTGRVYVANSGGNTVSVINGSTNRVIDNIQVGLFPAGLSINQNNSKIYVANSGINTVSVLDNTSTNGAKPIPIKTVSYDIDVNPKTNTIYVANYDSKEISVINGTTNYVTVGITFNINPPNSGYIECNGRKILDITHISYSSMGSELECEAIPYSGFQFSSWSGDLVAPTSNNRAQTKYTLSDYLFGSWFNSNDNDAKTTVAVSKYGILSANFIEPTQVSIPPEFWAPLYGLIPGFFIPSIISWLNGKRQRTHLRQYINDIGKLDKGTIEKNITNSYTKGKISESHYKMLKERISEYYQNMPQGSPIK